MKSRTACEIRVGESTFAEQLVDMHWHELLKTNTSACPISRNQHQQITLIWQQRIGVQLITVVVRNTSIGSIIFFSKKISNQGDDDKGEDPRTHECSKNYPNTYFGSHTTILRGFRKEEGQKEHKRAENLPLAEVGHASYSFEITKGVWRR